MNDQNLPLVRELLPYRGFSSKELARAIFDAEVPESVLRSLPPQSLFMVLRHNGLQASADLIEMATLEQCRLILDFDLWKRDSLNEEAFWEWLALTDVSDDLSLLQKIVKCIDLKLIALLMQRYIEVKTCEEPTEQPPEPGFHTPDKGFTWIGIKTEDPDKHFLLARLLALIFETNADLFYQLLSIPSVATNSILEEESFQERNKRLEGEGVPDPEIAAKINRALELPKALKALASVANEIRQKDVPCVSPLLFEKRISGVLSKLVSEIQDKDALESEFTYIMNSAIVFWNVDFSDLEAVLALGEKVKGAISLGLELIQSATTSSLKYCYEKLGLTDLYRLGLKEILDIRKLARTIPLEQAEKQRESAAAFSTLACAREAFPEMPAFLNDDGSVEEESPGTLVKGQRPIENLRALKTVRNILEGIALPS